MEEYDLDPADEARFKEIVRHLGRMPAWPREGRVLRRLHRRYAPQEDDTVEFVMPDAPAEYVRPPAQTDAELAAETKVTGKDVRRAAVAVGAAVAMLVGICIGGTGGGDKTAPRPVVSTSVSVESSRPSPSPTPRQS